MNGYLETQTAEKLQAACNSIKRASEVYIISKLYKLGLITEFDAKLRFNAIGVRIGDNSESSGQEKKPSKKFIPTKIFAKMLRVADPDWFWFSHDIFTTTDPEDPYKGQSIALNEATQFLLKNQIFMDKVRSYEPQTKEENDIKQLLMEGLP